MNLNLCKNLLSDLNTIIEQSRQRTATAVNSEMTSLYWNIGKRINSDVLHGERAKYGKQQLAEVSRFLIERFGSGWSRQHLLHCMKFASTFPDEAIVSALQRQLSWTHLKSIMYLDDPLKRDFYIEMAKNEHWSTRVLQDRINGMLFERTAISKQPENTIMNDLASLKVSGEMSPELVFRDPYFLDYLGLRDTYSEKDLEEGILAELQRFIVEFGSDFAFLSRQKRITIDRRDYYIDLLFFHRRLRCLVAIELKLGEFEAAFKGQMELYLRWLEKNEMVEGETQPIGLILCSGKNSEHVELMGLDKSNIRVAEYMTKLPDMKILEAKLHQSIQIAKKRFET
ncbi:MAG: PDDEXK nuclease domain-containing protein [Raoultibacter sp.]